MVCSKCGKRVTKTEEEKYKRLAGDVNEDEIIDGRDAIHLMKWLAEDEGADIDPDNADMNGDGTVDERDLIRMIQDHYNDQMY